MELIFFFPDVGPLLAFFFSQACLIHLCVSRQWVCVPFLVLSPVSVSITETAFNSTYQEPWLGTLDLDNAWKWMDDFLMLVSFMS